MSSTTEKIILKYRMSSTKILFSALRINNAFEGKQLEQV